MKEEEKENVQEKVERAEIFRKMLRKGWKMRKSWKMRKK